MREATRRKLSLVALAGCTAVVLGDSPAPQALCASYAAVDVSFYFLTDCPGAPPTGVVHWSFPTTSAAGDGSVADDLGGLLASQARQAGLEVDVSIYWDLSACATSGGDCTHTDPSGSATAKELALSWTPLGAGRCSPWQGTLLTDQALTCPIDLAPALDLGDLGAGDAGAASGDAGDAGSVGYDLAVAAPAQRECSLKLLRKN